MASQQRIADFGQALQDEQQVKKLGYLKKNTIYPGESVSGFVHVAWIKGSVLCSLSGLKVPNTFMSGDLTRKMRFY